MRVVIALFGIFLLILGTLGCVAYVIAKGRGDSLSGRHFAIAVCYNTSVDIIYAPIAYYNIISLKYAMLRRLGRHLSLYIEFIDQCRFDYVYKISELPDYKGMIWHFIYLENSIGHIDSDYDRAMVLGVTTSSSSFEEMEIESNCNLLRSRSNANISYYEIFGRPNVKWSCLGRVMDNILKYRLIYSDNGSGF